MPGGIAESSDNLVRVVNTEGRSGGAAGEIQPGKGAGPVHQSMLRSRSIRKSAHDLILVVNSHGLCRSGSGKIKLRECAVLVEKAMLFAGSVDKETDDIAARVDTVSFSRSAVRNIQLREVKRWRLGIQKIAHRCDAHCSKNKYYPLAKSHYRSPYRAHNTTRGNSLNQAGQTF